MTNSTVRNAKDQNFLLIHWSILVPCIDQGLVDHSKGELAKLPHLEHALTLKNVASVKNKNHTLIRVKPFGKILGCLVCLLQGAIAQRQL